MNRKPTKKTAMIVIIAGVLLILITGGIYKKTYMIPSGPVLPPTKHCSNSRSQDAIDIVEKTLLASKNVEIGSPRASSKCNKKPADGTG